MNTYIISQPRCRWKKKLIKRSDFVMNNSFFLRLAPRAAFKDNQGKRYLQSYNEVSLYEQVF